MSTERIDSYTLGQTLGKGLTATVKRAVTQSGRHCALKIFRRDAEGMDEHLMRYLEAEVEATIGLQHKHILQLSAFERESYWHRKDGSVVPVCYIALELAQGGELFDYIASSGPLADPLIKYYFRQILQGVFYLHSQGFAHRDLKPENILLDANYNVKLADFGFATPLSGRKGLGRSNSLIGTPGYIPPEAMENKSYQGQTSDVFALGVILFIMKAGYQPFKAANKLDENYALLARNRADLFWAEHSKH